MRMPYFLHGKPALMLLLFLLSPLLGGCSTLMTLPAHGEYSKEREAHAFSGTRQNIELLGSKVPDTWPGFTPLLVALDLPFSFVADVVCLPFTIPMEIAENRKMQRIGEGTGASLDSGPSGDAAVPRPR